MLEIAEAELKTWKTSLVTSLAGAMRGCGAIAMRGAATGVGTVCSSAHRPQLAEGLCGELSDPDDLGPCNRRAAVLASLFALTALQPRPLPANAATPYTAFLGEPRPLSMGTLAAADPATALADEVVASLVYEQVLGQGTFKTVFSVSSPLLEGRWALAVERMDTQDALREELHGMWKRKACIASRTQTPSDG